MQDAVIRALRTFFQGFLGVLMLIAIPALNQMVQSVASGGDIRLEQDFWQSVIIAAIAGGLIALISFLHNALEAASHTDIGPK